jgi:hypothetical protein
LKILLIIQNNVKLYNNIRIRSCRLWLLKLKQAMEKKLEKNYLKNKKGFARNMTLDHIIPKSKGGTNIQSNLIGACESCNTKKGSKTKHIKIKLPRKIIYQLPITPKIFTFSVYTILPKDIYQAGNKIKIHVMKKDINKYYFQTII